MSYVTGNLLEGEYVIYSARIHWIILLFPIIWTVVFCLLVYIMSGYSEAQLDFKYQGPDWYKLFIMRMMLLISFFLGIVALSYQIVYKMSTELAVTSSRIIAKFGLIRRDTTELNLSKVESLNVKQSISGRIFGFGTLTINGTGGVIALIPSIDDPLEFRRQAMGVINSSLHNRE